MTLHPTDGQLQCEFCILGWPTPDLLLDRLGLVTHRVYTPYNHDAGQGLEIPYIRRSMDPPAPTPLLVTIWTTNARGASETGDRLGLGEKKTKKDKQKQRNVKKDILIFCFDS
jgi:hypothetical protein